MVIRTKKYTHKDGRSVRAVQVTMKNLTDLVAYICRNGGAATGHLGRPEFNRPPRIRIKQRTSGVGRYGPWEKIDWRVTRLGDWIVKDEVSGEFVRIKAADFEREYTA